MKTLWRMALVVFTSGVASGLLLLGNILLARALPSTDYGDYITAFTLVNGAVFAAVFGMTQLLLQEFGRHGVLRRSYAISSIYLLCLSTAGACALVAIAAFGAPISGQARILAVILLPTLLAQVTAEIGSVYFQLIQRQWLTGCWFALLSALRFGASILFITCRGPLTQLATWQSLATVVVTIASVVLIVRLVGRFSTPDVEVDGPVSVGHVARDAAPYAVSSLMYFAIAQAPLLVFAIVAGGHSTAVYGVGNLLLSTIFFVPQVVMLRFLMMRYHELAKYEPAGLVKLYGQGNLFSALVGGTIAIVGAIAVPYGLPLVFGAKYQDAILLTQIMMACVPLRFATINIAALIAASGGMWQKNVADLIGGGVSITLFAVLVSVFGVMGGGVAAIATEVVLLGAHLVVARRLLPRAA